MHMRYTNPGLSISMGLRTQDAGQSKKTETERGTQARPLVASFYGREKSGDE